MSGPAGGTPEVLHVLARVHGRTLWRGAAGPGAGVGLLVGFHGYGEAADAQLDALDRIPGSERWNRAAIQALHPFYTRSGRVVASWMTRQDRELAIPDNVAYVADTLDALRRRAPGVPTVFCGFSQGTAMTWRAAAGVDHELAGILVLGGDVPPELSRESLSGLPAVLLGRGEEDTWYDEARLAADVERLEEAEVEVETFRFAGGHEWHPAFLERAGAFLDALARAD